MKRGLLLIVGLTLSFILVACNSNESGMEEKKDIKDRVHEYSVGDFKDITAAITSDELIVTEKGKETLFDLPEDEFFVSIAPYEEVTHP